MKKFHKQLLIKRHEHFLETLKILTDYFNKEYPGWEKTDDADYIKKRLKQAAKKICKNKLKKKYKHIKKEDFKEWPFVVDSIILVQTSKKWVSVIINMREYALNGLAATGLNISFAHDAGQAIKGKSVSEFIQIGLKL